MTDVVTPEEMGRLLFNAYWRGSEDWRSRDEFEHAGWIQTAEDFIVSMEASA